MIKFRVITYLFMLALLLKASGAGYAKMLTEKTDQILNLKGTYTAYSGTANSLNELGVGSRYEQITSFMTSFKATKENAEFTIKNFPQAIKELSQKGKAAFKFHHWMAQPPAKADKTSAITSGSMSDPSKPQIASIENSAKNVDVMEVGVKLHNPNDGIKRSTDKTIYGDDDRRDYYQINFPEAKKLAKGVASISNLSERKVHARGFCTAFLISKSRALTASHCVNFSDFRTKVLRFNDHVVAAGPLPGTLSSFEIGSIELWDHQRDISIIVLKPDSQGRAAGEIFPIFKLRKARATKGTKVYLIGHPGNDYKKFVPNCSVVREAYFHTAYGKHTLGVDCDAFGGNSGSPILRVQDHTVIGILWGGQSDTRTFEKATDSVHEFAVPFDVIAQTVNFDVGTWPLSVQFVSADQGSKTDFAFVDQMR